MKLLSTFVWLFCLATCVCIPGFSQDKSTKTHEIVFDFKEKKWKHFEEKNYKKGDYYRLKIEHINQNLYNIKINKRDSIVSGVQSFPSLEILSLDGLSSAISGVSEFFTSAPTSSAYKDAMEQISQKKVAKSGLEMLLMQNSMKLNFLSDSLILAQEKVSQQKIVDSIATLDNELKDLRNKMDTEIRRMNQEEEVAAKILETNSNLNANLNLLKDYDRIIDTINNNASLLYLSYLVDNKENRSYKLLKKNFSFEETITTTQRIRFLIDSVSKAIKQNQSAYAKYAEDNKSIIENTLSLKENDQKLKTAFKTGIESGDKIYGNISAEKVRALLEALLYLENNVSTQYVSLPLQFNGDMSLLDLSIEPREGKYGLQKYHTTLTFPVNRSYSGIGVSFYYNGLRNDAYSTKAVPVNDSTNNYMLVDEEHKKGEIGIAALLHFGGKICKSDYWGLHGTIGPAVSLTNKIKPRLAGGGGVSYGRKQMLTLDLLYMTGYVDRISNAYDLTTTYEEKPENVTISRLWGSFSLSIGYIYKF